MKWYSCVALVGLLGACSRDIGISDDIPIPADGNPSRLDPVTKTDVIMQAAIPQVDILWTIDNSGSMNCIVGCHGGGGNDFVRVTDEFDTFMSFLDGSGLDFHIGVTTADPDNEGELVDRDGIRWIDENTPNPIQKFTDIALSVGTSGGGVEMGFDSTFMAKEDQPSNGGFFRNDASLHTVMFSNEDDQSQDITPREFERWYSGLKPTFEQRSFNSIVCYDGNGQINGPCLTAGGRYLTATRNIGGVEWDITAEDYGTMLERLAIQAIAQRAEFFLSDIPVVDSLEVYIIIPDTARVKLPPLVVIDEETGETDGEWVYVPVRNSIRLEGDFRPPPLSTMEVTYTIASDVQPAEEPTAEE